jgi:flagellar hook assembly protein FlgD/prenyltransferase beta subunit
MFILFFFSSLSIGDGVDSIDPIGNVSGTYQAKYVRDLGGVAQIAFSGNLDVPSLDGGSSIFEPRAAIAREFFETHLDNYDFLVVMSDFDYEMPSNTAAFYMASKNEVTGIRRPTFDNTKSWGSNGRFRGYIDFHSVNDWELDPQKDSFFWTMTTLAHEVMHAWGGGVLYKDDNGAIQEGLIGAGSHWNALLDTSGSVMYGHSWLPLGGGEYKALEPKLAYSPLDLYLAGFYKEKEVPNFILYESEDTEKTDRRINGTTISVTGSQSISIEQVLAAEGSRTPSAEKAQKSFNAALILLSSDESYPSTKTLLGLNNIRENFENVFTQMTAGRGVLNFHTEEFKAREEIEEDVQLTSLNVDSAITWLLDQQSIIGFWGSSQEQRVRDTSISASILSTLLSREDYNTQPASSWLANVESIKNIEDATSLIEHNDKAKEYLINNRSKEGSWGVADGFNGSVLDTATVLISAPWLKNKSSIDYLTKNQNSDGGWSIVPNGSSSPSVTAKVLEALVSSGELQQAQLSLAVSFLSSKQTADGSFDIESMHSVLEAASIINSLVKINKLNAIDFGAALSFIERNQLVNGSWNNNAYTTAYIVNVFKDVQLPNLTFNSVDIDKVNVGVGNVVTITAVINNLGVAASIPVEVSLYNGDELIAFKELPSLSQDQGAELSFSFNVGETSGAKRINLNIDKNRSLVEKTKSDNETFVDIMVLERPDGVDLSIEKAVIVSPSELKVLPGTLQLSVDINNLGRSDSKSAQLVVYTLLDGDKNILAETNFEVASLERLSKSIDILLESSQASDLIVEVVEKDALDSIEFNNKKTLKIPFRNGVDYQILASEIIISDAPYIVNSDIQFSSRVWNRGVAAAPNTEVVYSVKSASAITEISRFSLFLNSNEYKEYNLTWTPSEAGDYQLIAVVDSENLISEIDESNNGASKAFSVSVEEGVNLSVSYKDILIQQDAINESESLITSVSVWNKGVEDTVPAQVSLYLGNPNEGGTLLDTKDVPSISSGSSKVVDLTWNNINVSKKHTIYVYVDPLNSIAESSESDNIGFIEIDIKPVSDLSISDGAVSLTPAILFEGSEATLSFDVLNLGGQVASDLSIKLTVNGTELDTLRGLTIGTYSKESYQYQFTAEASYSGSDIQIELDPLNRIIERNENNNVATHPILLSDSSFYVTERYISPNGDGIQDSTEIFYRVDGSGSITLTISKENSDIVISESSLPSSSYFKWSGKNKLGYLQEDGVYTVSIIDEESGGMLNTAVIEIDTNRSAISDAIGTEFGEIINLSDNLGGLELSYPIYTYENDQKIYFTAEGWLYRANYDGSNKEPLVEELYGEVVQHEGSWVLVRSGSYNSRFGDYTLINIDTKEKLSLKDMLPGESNWSREFVSLYFSGKDIVRLLVTDRKDNPKTLLYEINLTLRSASLISSLQHDTIMENPFSLAFSTRNGSLGYVRSDQVPILGNLVTGEIIVLDFNPLNVDEETQELLGFSNVDGSLIVSDLSGNIKKSIVSELVRVDYALFDGVNNKAVLFRSRGSSEICAGNPGEMFDSEDLPSGLGGVYVADLSAESVQKISNMTQFDYGECGDSDGSNYLKIYNSNYDDLLKIDGSPVSFHGYAYRYMKSDRYFGILKNGMFIDNADYILSPDFVMRAAPELVDKMVGNPHQQSTGLIQFKLDGTYQDTSLLFNDRNIESVHLSNSEQFLILTEETDGRYSKYSLFRSLMNLSVNLGATYNSKKEVIDVNVLAADKNFEQYKLFYRKVGDKEWVSLIEPRSIQVLGEKVHSWIPSEEGIYTIKLVAYDKAGNTRETTTIIPWVRSNPITSIKIDKEIFSPNSDGIKDSLDISYAVNQPYNLLIQFFNEEAQLVREESISYESASSHQSFSWDGLDQFGSKLPDGRYTVTVDSADFFVFLDSTQPDLISQCTDYLLNTPNKEDQRFFDPDICLDIKDDFLEEVNVYRKTDLGDWDFYKTIKKGNDYYLFSFESYSDFLGYEYQLRANDKAGNLLVEPIDIEKKLGYFRFVGMSVRDVEDLSSLRFQVEYYKYNKIEPNNAIENRGINILDYDNLELLNSYSDGRVEYQVLSDDNVWEVISLNSYPNRSNLKTRLSLDNPLISDGSVIRAVLYRPNETILSNEIFIDDKDHYVSLIKINGVGETNASIELDDYYNSIDIRVELFSLDDERYMKSEGIYGGDIHPEFRSKFETDLIDVNLCTDYMVSIYEDGILREERKVKSPCIALKVEDSYNHLAQCNEISGSINIKLRATVQSQDVMNSSTVELFVNNNSEGFVYSNSNPMLYRDDYGNYIFKNTFVLDTSLFSQGDDVRLNFSVTTDDGDVIGKSFDVPVDKEMPIFTQARLEKSCAIQKGGVTLYELRGQLIDRNKSKIHHKINYSWSSSLDETPVPGFGPNEDKAILQDNPDGSLYLKQGLIDYVGIDSSLVNKYFHAFDQSGNHTCVKVTDSVDFEVEGLEVSLINWNEERHLYYLSTSDKAGSREVLTLQADESVSVTIKLAEITKSGVRGDDLFTVYEGEYTSGILSLVSDDFDYQDGRYVLYAQVIDDCGITEEVEFKVVLDSIDPSIVLTNPISNEIRSITDLFGTISDENLDNYSIQFKSSDSNTWITLKESNNGSDIVNALLYRWDVNDLAGVYDLKIQAEDKSGNISSLVKTFTVIKGQSILVNFDLENRYISTLNEVGLVDFIVQTNMDAIGSIFIDDKLIFTSSLNAGINKVPVPVSALLSFNDGIYTAVIEAHEAAAPSIIEMLDIQVILDSTKVDIRFSESEKGPKGSFNISWNDTNHSQTNVRITGVQTDQLYAYDYSVNSSETYDLNQFDVAEGFFDFLVTSYDLAGNETVLEETVLFDREAPILLLKNGLDKYINQKNASLPVEFLVQDLFLKGVNIRAGDSTLYEALISESGVILNQINLSDFKDGPVVITIEAYDQADNRTSLIESVILDSTPPELDMNNSIWNIGGGQLISFLYLEENIDNVEVQFDSQAAYTIYRQNQGAIPWPNSIPDGEYSLLLKAVDLAGNKIQHNLQVSRDTQPPEAVASLTLSTVDSTTVELTWLNSTSTDVASYKLYRNDALISESTGNVYLDESLLNGIYSYQVTAVDNFGNESEPSNEVKVVVDTIPPSIDILSLSNGQMVSGLVPITLTIPDSDLESFRVVLINSDGTETLIAQGGLPIFSFQVAILDTVDFDSNLKVKVEAKDIAGNAASKTVAITVDNTVPMAPTISASLDVDVLTLNVTQIDENASGFSIYRNDELVETLTQATLSSWSEALVEDGFYTYYLVQHSNANVPSKPSNIEQVYLDLSAPRFEILSPFADGLFELELPVDIKYLDKDIGTVSINIFDATKSVLQVSKRLNEAVENTKLDISNLQYTNYVLSVTVTDLTGNAVTKDVTFAVVDITAPDPVDSASWRTEEGELYINWEYDSQKVIQQDIDSFEIVILDEYGDYIYSNEAGNQDRESIFTLEEGIYGAGIFVIDSAGNESLIARINDIELIKQSVIIPYTPDVVSQKSLTVIPEFSGGLWVEKNDQVIFSQTVNIDELVKVPLVLDAGINRFKVYGDYGNNITIPVYIDLILSSYPAVLGTAIFDSQLETISINRQPEANEHGYLVFDNQISIQDVASSSATNSGLVDGSTSTYINIYDDVKDYEILYQQPELLANIEISYPIEYLTPEKVVLEAWTGSNWIQLPHSHVTSEEGVSLILDKPYLTTKVKLTFYKPSSQNRMRVSEVTTLVHKVFTGNEINTALINFENQDPYLKIVNTHGIVSEGLIQVVDVLETLTVPELQATVNGVEVTLSFNLPSDATTVHLFRDGIDIGSYVNTENTFIDTNLKNGQYTYYAVSYDSLGNRSPMSTKVSVDIYQTKLTKPENLEAHQDQDSIRLSWSPVEYASSYQIYRKTTLSNQWIELSITQEIEYLDSSAYMGTPYMYKVAALDEIGNIGEDSGFITALIQSDKELFAPKIINPKTNTQHQDSVELLVKSKGVSYIGVNVNGVGAGVFPVNDSILNSMSFSAQGNIDYSGTISTYIDRSQKIKSIINNEGEASLGFTPSYAAAFDGGSHFSNKYQINHYTNDLGEVAVLNTGNIYHYSLSSSLDGNTVVYNERYSLWAFDVIKSEKQLIDPYYYGSFDLKKTAVDLTGSNIAYIRSSTLYISTKQSDGTFLKRVVPDMEHDSIDGLIWKDSELVVLYSLNNSYRLRKLDSTSNQWSEPVSISLSNISLVGVFDGSIVVTGLNEDNQFQLASYQSDLQLEWLLPSPFFNNYINLTSSGHICRTKDYYWYCFALPGLTKVSIPIENGDPNVISAYGINNSGLYSEQSNLVNVISDEDEFINASVSLQKIRDSESGQITFIASTNMLSGDLASQELNMLLVSENGEVLIDDYQAIPAMSEGEELKVMFTFTPVADTNYVAKVTLLQADSDNTDNTSILKFYIADPNESNPDIKVTQINDTLQLRVVNVDVLSGYLISVDIESNGNIESFLWNDQDIANQLVTLSISGLAMSGSLDVKASLISNEQVLDTDSLTIIFEDRTDLSGNLELPSLVTGNNVSVSASLFGDVIDGYFNGSYALTIMDENASLLDAVFGTLNWLAQGETHQINQDFNLSNIENGDYKAKLTVTNSDGDVVYEEEKAFSKQNFTISLILENTEVTVPTRSTVALPFKLEGVLANYIDNLTLYLETTNQNYEQSYSVDSLPVDGILRFENLDQVSEIEGRVRLSYQVNIDGNLSQENAVLDTIRISVVDVTPPSLISLSPIHNGFINQEQNIQLQVMDTDNSSVRIEFAQNEISRSFDAINGIIDIPSSILKYGVNTFDFKLIDEFNNTSSLETYTVIYDDMPPNINIVSTANELYSKVPFTIRTIVEDDYLDSSKVTLNGSVITVDEVSVINDGFYRYEVSAIDKAGNKSANAIQRFLDQMAPVLLLDGVQHELISNQDINFSIKVIEENIERFEVTLNDSVLELSGPGLVNQVVVDEGVYSIKATAVDKAGWSESLDIQFEIDKTAPAEPVLEYENNHTFDVELVMLSGTAEANTSIQLDLNGVVYHGLVDDQGNFTFANIAFQIGQNDLVVMSKDKAGNQSTQASYTYYRMDPLDVESEMSVTGINKNRVLFLARNSTEATALTSYLSSQKLDVTIVDNSDQFMEEIRSMSYATLLIGNVNGLNGLINRVNAFESLELRSYIANGLNVVILDGSVSFLNLWGDVVGLKHVSLPFKASAVTLDSESIGTLNVQDKMKAYDLAAYSTAFSYGNIKCAMRSFICRKYGETPAFVLNQYGNGHVVTFGFDILDYVNEGQALIAKLINFIAHSNGSNFEYRDLSLLLSTNQDTPLEKDRISISLQPGDNGLINGSSDEQTFIGQDQLEVNVRRIDLNNTVQVIGSVYVDDILKDEVSLALFEVRTWANLTAALDNEVESMQVDWLQSVAYIKFQYAISKISDECNVESCDVRHLRKHVYLAMLKWRIFFKDEVKVLERFGEILMYLDYVERKQGAL